MLADIISRIEGKYIVRAALGLVGFMILIAGLGGGFVFISSGDETVIGYSQRTDASDTPKEPLTIGKGSWKLVYLGLGDYHIELSSGNKKSLYQPSVGMFSFQALSVSLHSQRQSKSLGFQNSDCLTSTPGSKQVIFFSCNKSVDNQRTVSLTNNGFDFKDYVSGDTAAPYLGGLLQIDDFSNIDAEAGTITASSYDANGGVSAEKNTQFETTLYDPRLITDARDSKNSRFVFYDPQKKVAYLFKNLHDAPEKIDLHAHFKQKDGFVFDFYLDGNKLYVSNALNFEKGLGYGDEEPFKAGDADNQSFSSFNFDSPGKPQQISLSPNLILERFVANNEGIVFSAYTADHAKGGVYTVPANKKDAELLFNGQVLDICVNDDKMYYLSDDNEIYNYLPAKRTAFLVYKSLNHNPVNLNCVNGSISFPSQTKEGGDSDYTWTTLEESNLAANKTRVEDLFPIIEDPSYRISYAYVFSRTVYVVLNGNGVCGELDKETRDITLRHFKDLGLDTAAFAFDIRYDC